MAGPTLDRELRQKPDSATAQFAIANCSEDAELRAFLRSHPTPGDVSLRFEREPSYFAGEYVAGARDTTIVARQNGRIVCMGRCSRRELYLDGKLRTIGYLGELRLAPNTQRGLEILRRGYTFFAQLEAANPADFYFTSVAVSNSRAQTVLESGRLGLPLYQPLAKLQTLACPVRKSARKAKVTKPAAESELTEFLDTWAREQNLASPWSEQSWFDLQAGGLAPEHFSVVRRAGRIVAAAGLWDQTAWRQTVIHDYSGRLRWLRPILNPGLALAGCPRLPAPGQRLRQACLHPFVVAPDVPPNSVAELIDSLEAQATQRGLQWLVVSAADGDPMLFPLLRRFGTRSYETQLYTVRLPEIPQISFDRAHPIRPEVGFL